MSETIETDKGETISVAEIVNVIPYRDGLLMALTVSESGDVGEHKVNASEYYTIKGSL